MKEITLIPSIDDLVEVVRVCPFCGRRHVRTFWREELENGIEAYKRGALIQQAFPNMSPSDREFLKTGICDDCWDNL